MKFIFGFYGFFIGAEKSCRSFLSEKKIKEVLLVSRIQCLMLIALSLSINIRHWILEFCRIFYVGRGGEPTCYVYRYYAIALIK